MSLYENIELPIAKKGFKQTIKQANYMHYNRLVLLVIIVNLIALIWGINKGWWSATNINLESIANITLINISMAILIRQQYVVNFLFWLATRAPTSWPLSIRWTLGKVYHYGGLHKGGNMVGTLWFIIYSISASYQYFQLGSKVSLTSLMLSYSLIAILVIIVIMAQKTIRAKYHDAFEISHRFGGWSALILFWVLILSQTNDAWISNNISEISFTETLINAFGFWCLSLVTFSIILPWLRLKKVPIKIDTPSDHVALVTFDYGVTPFAGSSTAISLNPLFEWHSFANVPAPNTTGFRLTISSAGDWTKQFIKTKPQHVWVRGVPQAGVAYIEVLFKKVIYVATGSGIGPVLPHLLSNKVPSKLVWATRNPRKTYGDKLLDQILEVQEDALIWDTDEHGKPDLVKLAYQAHKQFDAEAVICISNEKLTWQVVSEMEKRGIPAYGAIWDS